MIVSNQSPQMRAATILAALMLDKAAANIPEAANAWRVLVDPDCNDADFRIIASMGQAILLSHRVELNNEGPTTAVAPPPDYEQVFQSLYQDG